MRLYQYTNTATASYYRYFVMVQKVSHPYKKQRLTFPNKYTRKWSIQPHPAMSAIVTLRPAASSSLFVMGAGLKPGLPKLMGAGFQQGRRYQPQPNLISTTTTDKRGDDSSFEAFIVKIRPRQPIAHGSNNENGAPHLRNGIPSTVYRIRANTQQLQREMAGGGGGGFGGQESLSI